MIKPLFFAVVLVAAMCLFAWVYLLLSLLVPTPTPHTAPVATLSNERPLIDAYKSTGRVLSGETGNYARLRHVSVPSPPSAPSLAEVEKNISIY